MINVTMKSAYELAMERLEKSDPTVKLSDEKKAQMAELDSKYGAKIAEREIFLNGELEKARAAGDLDTASQVERQLANEKKALQAELEEKKEALRA